MKNVRLLIFSVIALGAVSCTKNEVVAPRQGQVISYDVLTQKAAISFPTTMTFKSTAYRLNNNSYTWDANKSSASIYRDGNNSLNNQEVKFMGTYWGTDTEFTWPNTGSLTFFSYRQPLTSPSISTDGVSFSGWDVSSHRNESFDNQTILVADIAKDKKQNESYASFSGVPTHFRHKLVKLCFNSAISPLAPDGTTVTIKKMYLKNVYLKGDYSRGGYTNDAWSNLSSLSSEYSVISSAVDLTSTVTVMGSEMVMIPQFLTSDAKLCIEYTITQDGTTSDKKEEISFLDQFRNGEWAKGTFYNYTIYIGVGTYPIEFDGNVSDWTTLAAGDIIIGG